MRIAVFARLDARQIERITAVDSGVDVRYVGDELCIDEERVDLTVPHPEAAARLRPLLSEAEILLGYPAGFAPPYPLSKLRWVQLVSAGTNHVQDTPLWNAGTIVTNASGVAAHAVAEHALMCMLMLTGDAWRLFRQQQRRDWQLWRRATLAGRSVGVLGCGAIGSEVARLCAAFNMHVCGLDAVFASHRMHIGAFHDVYPVRDLHAMLAGVEYLVNCLPLTPATTHLVDAEAIAAMPRGSFVVSVSRGPVLDVAALTAALRTGHLGGAALDVTDPEPLPVDHPLWNMPNVIITPHMAGCFHHYMDRLTTLFCQNLRFYVQRMPLVNVVNMEVGY
jgi:D-2-hydroxyacid dehydrogenase (NADP+)